METPPPRRAGSLLLRVFTASALLPFLLVVVWIHSLAFAALLFIVAFFATWELCRMAKKWGRVTVFLASAPISMLLVVLGMLLLSLSDFAALSFGALLAALAVASAAFLLFSPRARGSSGDILAMQSIAFVIGAPLYHAAVMRAMPDGLYWILYLFAVTFATDTCAYFVGRAFGSAKLAPSISPNKTWEGAVGGLAGAIGMGGLFGWIEPPPVGGAVWMLGASAILGAIGQLGDLYMSKLKRLADMGDSSALIPGHGGFLDRMDSLMFNVLALAYLKLPFIVAMFGA